MFMEFKKPPNDRKHFPFAISHPRDRLKLLKLSQQMGNNIQQFLENQGFNQKDSAVYLDIYRHGQSFASSIAARTGIDRTTTYSAIKRLLKTGVIVQTRVNSVSAYTAVSPEIFLDKIDLEMDEMVARRKAAALFVSEIKKIRQHSYSKPKIRIFEGEDAIINLYEETLGRGGEQKSFLTIQEIPAGLRDFLRHSFIKSKLRKKVFSKVLLADSPQAKRYQSLDSRSNRETRLIKNNPFDLQSEIILFGSSEVAIIDFNKNIFGLVIDSKTLYKTMSSIFDCLWSR